MRIPFTSEIIPKRKAEIGACCGGVVSAYLLTSTALQAMLNQSEIRQQVLQTLNEMMERWLSKEYTLKQWVVQLFPTGEREK